MVDTQDYQADCELQKLSERIDGHLVYSSVVDAVSFVGDCVLLMEFVGVSEERV